MPRDEWCRMWLAAHGIAGIMLRSPALADAPKRQGGMDAAGAIYDIASETSALRWLLDPKGKWLQRIVAIGAFYAPLAREVAMDLRARRAKPAGSGQTEVAARQDAPPAPRDGLVVQAIDG
jgi:hypothetical protein